MGTVARQEARSPCWLHFLFSKVERRGVGKGGGLAQARILTGHHILVTKAALESLPARMLHEQLVWDSRIFYVLKI